MWSKESRSLSELNQINVLQAPQHKHRLFGNHYKVYTMYSHILQSKKKNIERRGIPLSKIVQYTACTYQYIIYQYKKIQDSVDVQIRLIVNL